MAEVSTHIAEDLKNAGVRPPQEDETALEEDVEGTKRTQESVDEDLGNATEADVQFARDNGWTPRENWHGDPEKYETAKDFADRARGINQLLQRRLSSYQTELQQLRDDVKTLTEGGRKNQLREIDTKIEDARARRVDALSNGDGAAVDAAERELSQLGAERATLQPGARVDASTKKPDAENATVTMSDADRAAVKAWEERNTWLKDTPKLARLAKPIAEEVRNDRPDLVGNVTGFLAELESRVKSEYPEYFPTMRRSRTDSGTSTRVPAGGKKRTYDNLPPDAKAACDRMMKRGLIRKQEDYVKNYDWGD